MMMVLASQASPPKTSVLLLGVFFLKNPPPVLGKGENLEILWKQMSKWDLKAVTLIVF